MEKKKGCLVGFAVLSFVFLAIVIGIVSCDGDKKTPAPTATDPDKKEAVYEPPAETVSESPAEKEDDDTASLVSAALGLLEANFKDSATVRYDEGEKSFYITPTDPGFAQEALAALNGDAQALEDWAFLVESARGLSKSMAKIISDHYLQVVNPDNPDLSLLILLDGYVYYNFVDE